MKTSVNSSSTSSSVVQSNSVLPQFAALSRDREEARNAIQAAEKEYKNVLDELQKLKTVQTNLEAETSLNQEDLGTQTSKLTMLRQENARKKRIFENERKALEQCSRETESLVEKESASKESFRMAMVPLNDEMDALLQQKHDFDFQKTLSVLSLRSTAVLSELVNVEGIQKSFHRLEEVEGKVRYEAQEYRAREEKLRNIRFKAENGVTDAQANDTTQDPTGQETILDSDPNQDNHMNLFYGSQQD